MAQSSLPQPRPPHDVLLVRTDQELIEAVTVARRQNRRLQVAGHSRGLGLRGSTDPAGDDTVLLDLSGMSRILDFDPVLGHVTVEPGVTFAQLHAFLQERDAAWFMPSIGGPSDARVLGSFLQLSLGFGPHVRRPASILTLAAILSTGEMLELSDAAGPDLRGLFLRSTLGVVTRLRIKLTAKPVQLQIVTAAFEEAAEAIDAALELRKHLLQGALGHSVMTIWMRTKLELFNGADEALAPQAPWLFTGALYAASQRHADLARDTLLQTLPKARYMREDEVSANVRAAFLGGPSMVHLDALPTGLVWICPALPFTRRALETAVRLLDKLNADVWPLSASFHVDDPSSIDLFIRLHFDPASTPQDRVQWVVHAVLREFESAGVPCTRCSVIDPADERDHSDWKRRLRRALDPDDLWAPTEM